jgi:hypothetical protein
MPARTTMSSNFFMVRKPTPALTETFSQSRDGRGDHGGPGDVATVRLIIESDLERRTGAAV